MSDRVSLVGEREELMGSAVSRMKCWVSWARESVFIRGLGYGV